MAYSNDFEEKIESPSIEDSESLPDIVQHISEVSDAIDKCEKMLQHIAIGNFSSEFQEYMSQHIQLIAKRNELHKKLKCLEEKQKSNQQPSSN